MARDEDRARLLRAVEAWVADDPDEGDRAQLRTLLSAARSADGVAAAAARAELSDRFAGLLDFGTAGLRGPLGAGPRRMNRAVVIRAAAGLTAYLSERDPHPSVVVGYDARHGSARFAHDTAEVVSGAGGQALLAPQPWPTPVLAYAVRALGADAGVMVTASHNPAADNGYKVYLDDGAQLVAPADAHVRERMMAVPSVAATPRDTRAVRRLDDTVWRRYVETVAALARPGGPRAIRVAHTSLHGVGHATVQAVFARAGFPPPIPVGAQAEPDPDFPTVAFPNPEEPGALDAVLRLAAHEGADLAIANDPDADRCAVAVPQDGSPRWRVLRGDEVGALLAAHILARGVSAHEVFARSIVSSRLVDAMAADAGIGFAQTLTGFKWIARTPRLRYGYEEALGYCVAPRLVRDKDGVSAALLVAELAAELAESGRSLVDVLDELALRHGVHATDAFAVRVGDPALIAAVLGRLRANPRLGDGERAAQVDDLAAGCDGLPPTEGLRLWLADGTRVIVRPSGTEPKLKVYLEAVVPVAGADRLPTARAEAQARLRRAREAYTALTQP